GLARALAEIHPGLVPHLATDRVMCELFDVLGQTVWRKPLDRIDDTAVQSATATAEQAAVGHVMGDGVLEGVLEIREQLRLVQELSSLEPTDLTAQHVLWDVRDRPQDCVRHVLAHHRGRLQYGLVLEREPVDPGRKDRLHCGWHLDGSGHSREPVCSGLSVQDPGLDERPDTLFEKEWVALRPFNKEPLQRVKAGTRTQ